MARPNSSPVQLPLARATGPRSLQSAPYQLRRTSLVRSRGLHPTRLLPPHSCLSYENRHFTCVCGCVGVEPDSSLRLISVEGNCDHDRTLRQRPTPRLFEIGSLHERRITHWGLGACKHCLGSSLRLEGGGEWEPDRRCRCDDLCAPRTPRQRRTLPYSIALRCVCNSKKIDTGLEIGNHVLRRVCSQRAKRTG